jgi:predicted class III extradiol MEMO1 family dioxygenase
MSHYLTKAQALENDRTTIAKLISFDEEFFSSAKDDFTDNGASFIVLDGLFEALGIEPSFELLGHGISADYVSDDRVTTSYINGFWLK